MTRLARLGVVVDVVLQILGVLMAGIYGVAGLLGGSTFDLAAATLFAVLSLRGRSL